MYLNFLSVNVPLEVLPLDDDVPDDEEGRQVLRKFLDFDGETFDVLFDLVRRYLGSDLVESLPEGLDLGQGFLALPSGRERSSNFVAHDLREIFGQLFT